MSNNPQRVLPWKKTKNEKHKAVGKKSKFIDDKDVITVQKRKKDLGPKALAKISTGSVNLILHHTAETLEFLQFNSKS